MMLQFNKLENFLFLFICPFLCNFAVKLPFVASVSAIVFSIKSMVSISSTFILSVLQRKLYHIYKGNQSFTKVI